MRLLSLPLLILGLTTCVSRLPLPQQFDPWWSLQPGEAGLHPLVEPPEDAARFAGALDVMEDPHRYLRILHVERLASGPDQDVVRLGSVTIRNESAFHVSILTASVTWLTTLPQMAEPQTINLVGVIPPHGVRTYGMKEGTILQYPMFSDAVDPSVELRLVVAGDPIPGAS